MKKDIEIPEVKNVGICAVPENVEGMDMWKVYLINRLDNTLEKVFVNSRGYGIKDSEEVQTSGLKHFFETISAQSSQEIELIPNDLAGLNNQYRVSFFIGNQIYDKKVIFVPDSLKEDNMIHISIVDKKGILII